MSDPVTPAAETPEPVAPSYALTPEQELSGDWTEAPKPVEDADAEDEPEPAAVAATPEPTPEKPVSKRQQHINDLTRKAAEAESARAELAARLAAVEARTTPAAEPKPAEPVVDPKDPEPQEANFEDYRQFVKAQARWEIRQAKREADAETETAQRAQAEQQQRAALQTTRQAWSGRRDAFTAKHPDKADRLLTFLDNVHSGTPIGDTILESEVGAELSDYLAANPAEAERIARLAPISALRALGKLEAQFDAPLPHASAHAQPAAKLVTTAPAPPMTLAARSAAPADPTAAAVDSGDFAAFEAEENRRALA